MSARGIVVVGGFAHESNSFTPRRMRLEDFHISEGEAGFRRLAMEDSEYAGIQSTLTARGFTVFSTVDAGATVGGLIEEAVFDHYWARLQEMLDEVPQQEVVGLQWVLHGSAWVVGHEDAQSELMSAIRTRFPAVPLVVSMDLHSTITPALLQQVDGLVHYQTAPHVDMVETGRRASVLLDRLIGDKVETERVVIKLPLLLPGEFGQTGSPVMQRIYQDLALFAQSSRALDVSLSQGFPWADNPQGTVGLVGIWPRGAVDERLLDALREIAQRVWDARDDIHRTVLLKALENWPTEIGNVDPVTVYCDSGDNPTAGGTEDRVDVLAVALAHRLEGILFLPIVDAEFVDRCHDRSPGDTVTANLGGTLSATPSVPIEGHIIRLGRTDRTGRFAVVEVEANTVVVTEQRFGVSTPTILTDLGFASDSLPRAMVVKSGYLFAPWKDWLTRRGGQEILLSTAGATTLDLKTLPYQRMADDNFPLRDKDSAVMTQYRAAGRELVDAGTTTRLRSRL